MTLLTTETENGKNHWVYQELTHDPKAQAYQESLFAVGNGYLGVRGYYDEGYGEMLPDTAAGCFINGVYESLPIHYDESAYGLAENCHRMIDVPRLEFGVQLDGQAFDMAQGEVESIQRSLDLRTGIYRREVVWLAPNGKKIRLDYERVALLDNRHVLLARLTMTAINFKGTVTAMAHLNAANSKFIDSEDPREGGAVPRSHWQCLAATQESTNAIPQSQFLYEAKNSAIQVVSSLSTSGPGACSQNQESERLSHSHAVELSENSPVSIQAIVTYHDSRGGERDVKLQRSGQQLCHWYSEVTYQEIMRIQTQKLADFWRVADIEIEADDDSQLAARFALFHLLQSTGSDGRSSIAAKGVTGAGYDGHYFWDSEIYVFPFWLFTDPRRAKGLLQYRVSTLDSARKIARKMGHEKGALFAWRTIGGEECSSFFPAGTAQYHINADIAYASRSYVRITQDIEFLEQGLAELVLETARIWMNLGHFSQQQAKECFSIHEVTGPDEYTAMVDNNFYTNRMAQAHLFWAVEVLNLVSESVRKELLGELKISESEIKAWERAAKSMVLVFNQALEIYEQHDGFLRKPKWDFANTPKDKYPLLLNFHPLVIYRHQVLKQADVVLALILEGEDISSEIKANSFDYYEPITTHDSTLSPCVHGVLASEIGRDDIAHEYILETLGLDLQNKHHNTHYGVHTAAMGGVWMGIVQGFAGLRYGQGRLRFTPKLPQQWQRLRFCLRYRDAIIEVTLAPDKVVYHLLEGDSTVGIQHFDETVQLNGRDRRAEFLT